MAASELANVAREIAQRVGPSDDRIEPETEPGLWTVERVAEYLGVASKTVRRLMEQGELTWVRVGGQIRFRPEDVQAFLRRNELR